MTPRLFSGKGDIERALLAVGELLAARGETQSVVVVGGAALCLLGVVARATRDVDILAFARADTGTPVVLIPPPVPLPDGLVAAIRTVGRDFGLADEWLNTGPALQWRQGLPPGLETRVEWRRYAALTVGVAGRRDHIWLKLYAAADDRPAGRHVRDLMALQPTDAELAEAARWVKTQDAGDTFPSFVDEVIDHVRANRTSPNG